MKQYKVTITNGDYPLSYTCDAISDAFECLRTLESWAPERIAFMRLQPTSAPTAPAKRTPLPTRPCQKRHVRKPESKRRSLQLQCSIGGRWKSRRHIKYDLCRTGRTRDGALEGGRKLCITKGLARSAESASPQKTRRLMQWYVAGSAGCRIPRKRRSS